MSTVTECAAKRRPAAVPSLYIRIGGKYTPAPQDVLLDHVRKWAVNRFRPGALVLDHPLIIEAFLLAKLAAREHEVFAVVLLDSERRLIEYVEASQGHLHGVNICSREIVKVALRHNASSVVFAHNHPSGRTEPSQADIATTRRLRDALAYVDIRVIDHLIVGKTITSFAKRGLLAL
jgi:DNA repair protein RadC